MKPRYFHASRAEENTPVVAESDENTVTSDAMAAALSG